MYTHFSKITLVVLNIRILFRKAKSEKFSYVFMLFIRHFSSKLWRHNECVLRSDLDPARKYPPCLISLYVINHLSQILSDVCLRNQRYQSEYTYNYIKL